MNLVLEQCFCHPDLDLWEYRMYVLNFVMLERLMKTNQLMEVAFWDATMSLA
jgi:hypothetical protein